MVDDESDILRSCQRGDEGGLARLVERFQLRVFNLACQVLRDRSLAEDAAADALATVWEKCRSWKEESSAATWIHRVALNVILDHQRAGKRWWRFRDLSEILVRTEETIDPAETYAEAEARDDEAKKLEAAIGMLSAEGRALIHLHYFDGMRLSEIAEILNLKRDVVKMRLSRLRAELREFLGKTDNE